jgi:hypothetical protein
MHTPLAAWPLVVLLLVLAAFGGTRRSRERTAISVLRYQRGPTASKATCSGMTSGNAIDIQANNVVLDLNGFKLGGLSAGLGTNTFGVFALDRQNITIKNGTIRGFRQGIVLDGSLASQGHIVEDIRAAHNIQVGIHVGGSGNIVRNNQVVATGGTINFGPNADVFGIYATGPGTRVLNNDVIATVPTGFATGYGILFLSGSDALAVNNRISTAGVGIDFGDTGKYRDNLTIGVSTPYLGGSDAGNNN